MSTFQRILTSFVAIVCAGFCATTEAPSQMMNSTAAEEPRKTVGFDQVRPILRKRCQNCHNAEELRGDLSVVDIAAIRAGSSSGPVVVEGKPRESLLYTTTAHLDEPTMPPNSRKIPARELEVLKRWIEDGLLLKSGDIASTTSSSSETAASETTSFDKPNANFETVRPQLQNTTFAALAAEPNGSRIAVPGQQQIVLIDLKSGQMNGIPFGTDETKAEITAIEFDSEGKNLIIAGGMPGLSGSVYGFDIDSGKQIFSFADESDSVIALALSNDNSKVAFGGPSKILKICSATSGDVLHTMRKHTDWVLTTAFSPDGLLLASGDRFGGLFVWEVESGKLFHSLQGHTGPVHAVSWDVDGETLLSAGEDGTIRVWNLHHGGTDSSLGSWSGSDS